VRAAALLLVLCLTAARVLAQAPPSLLIEAPPELAPARARLESYDPRPLADIVKLVGLGQPGPPMRVVLAAADSPWARQVTPWTAGFAVGDGSLIVLFPSRSPTYPHDTLEDVLRHEVAHILISRAAGERPVPRWFHEGLAMAVERPWGLEYRTLLASALLFGPRLTLGSIDALFSGDQETQARGYSLSAAVVRDIISEHGAAAPAKILRRVADGWSFDEAIASVTQRSIPSVEDEFWDRQRTWTMWIPLLASSTVVWLGVIGLAALAVRRRRRRAADLRRRWDAEDAAPREQESTTPEV
jgi:MYXO-CTERM domain-containing protein